MNLVGVKPKKIVFFPDALFEKKYIGELWGKHFAKSKVFNVFSDEKSEQYAKIYNTGHQCPHSGSCRSHFGHAKPSVN